MLFGHTNLFHRPCGDGLVYFGHDADGLAEGDRDFPCSVLVRRLRVLAPLIFCKNVRHNNFSYFKKRICRLRLKNSFPSFSYSLPYS